MIPTSLLIIAAITGPAQHLASDITGSITKRDLQYVLRLVLTDLFRDALLEILEAIAIIATSYPRFKGIKLW